MNRFSFIISLTVIAFGICRNAQAQIPEDLPNLKEIKGKDLTLKISPLQHKKGKWGYADSEGKFVVKPIFDAVCPYEGSVARVKFNGQWGTISNSGLFVILPVYDGLEYFSSDSLAIVMENTKYGLIDRKGRFVQKVHYDSLCYVDYGYRAFKDGKCGTIAHDGSTIIDPQYDEIRMLDRRNGVELVYKDGLWGILKDGSDLLALKWDVPLELLRTGSNGRPDLYLAVQNGKYGVVTVFGQYVTPCVYDEITEAISGRYYVIRQGDRYGAVSLDMTELVCPKFEDIPSLGKKTFKIYDEGVFTAVSDRADIPVPFGLYTMLLENELGYNTTKEIPEWSKTLKLEANHEAREEEIAVAMRKKTDCEQSSYDSSFGLAVEDVDKYGIEYPDDMAANASVRVWKSLFGGRYECSAKMLSFNEKNPLVRYDRSGSQDWTFVPSYGEEFYDIDETDSYIYICGSRKAAAKGDSSPLIVQLNKRGERLQEFSHPFSYAYFSGIACKDHLLYAKTSYRKGKGIGPEYYPFHVLEELGDDFGVHLCCEWDDWGGGELGGCGLVDARGRWLDNTAMAGSDQICNAYGWEFGNFTGEYLIVRHLGKYGLVNRSGEFTIEAKYDFMEYMDNPSYVMVSSEGRYGVLDSQGKQIVPMDYDYVGKMGEDLIIVKKYGQYGCYDKNGELVVPMEYEEIREYVGGMARIKVKDRFGFIDKNGELIVAPFSDEVENFSEGFALVTIKDRLGFVSLDGDWIAVPMYEDGGSFSGGLAYLSHNGKYGYIDRYGEFVIPMQYDKVMDFDPEFGVACVSSGGKWGVIDKVGKVVVPIEYDSVSVSSDGYVKVGKDDRFGIWSCDGKMVYPTECESVAVSDRGRMFRYGAAEGRIDGVHVRIDVFGNVVHQYSLMNMN